ncbi:uncharacterized protein MELLADRAFT_124045 [Melampsora larici-populina 98AG31]|uniref:Secreted protein n=1 Tax=Melampsora larici-populina (strain 98AG31 / pathotype 3-4-7) TaxID=747676 RepID=F4RSU2_MELLP|nr:uncharacterized protein MELLADRAFT_124045 [Melampsora larici-populina 98AG31]EGG04546.1 secreted protein [Melampsora larici-populina 98AG31]
MIFRTYILIIFSLLTLFGKSNSRSCKWAFERVPKDPAHSYCSDQWLTYIYPTADCKPQKDPKGLPTASNCESMQFCNAACPTWRASGLRKMNQATSYMCDILTKKGATRSQDQYTKIKCQILTNVVACDGKGVLVGKDIP